LEVNSSSLDIAYPALPVMQDCDSAPVETQVCDAAWVTAEYSSQGWFAKAPTAACSPCLSPNTTATTAAATTAAATTAAATTTAAAPTTVPAATTSSAVATTTTVVTTTTMPGLVWSHVAEIEDPSNVEIGTTGDLGLIGTSFTFLGWVKYNRRLDWHHPIIEFGGSKGTNNGVGFRSGHGLYIALEQPECYGGGYSYTENEWTHLAFVYDHASQSVKIYRDGVMKHTCGPQPITTDVPLRANAQHTWGNTKKLHIFSRALTEAEVSQFSTA